MIHVGIDPGVTGACAVIAPDGIEIHDTPTVRIKQGKSFKNRLDPHAAALLLRAIEQKAPSREIMVTIEKVAPMPSFNRNKITGEKEETRTMGASSAFNFGMEFGMWIAICAALFIPYQLVAPQRWKRLIMPDMAKGKDSGRVKAQQLYPRMAEQLKLKKHVGRADALLLAHYGTKTFSPESTKTEEDPQESLGF